VVDGTARAASDWSVELEHRVPGSPDEVFEYFTDPDKYRRWQGQDVELEPRPGGAYQVTMAPRAWVRGEVLEIDRPDRLVMTWGFVSDGFALPRGLEQVPPGSSVLEFTFRADGDDTIIKVRHTGLPTEEARWAHEQGWRIYLPRITALQRDGDAGRDPIITLTALLFARDAEPRA
jgi:uncharacterized protein YndB with AHSA1/START domain